MSRQGAGLEKQWEGGEEPHQSDSPTPHLLWLNSLQRSSVEVLSAPQRAAVHQPLAETFHLYP